MLVALKYDQIVASNAAQNIKRNLGLNSSSYMVESLHFFFLQNP